MSISGNKWLDELMDDAAYFERKLNDPDPCICGSHSVRLLRIFNEQYNEWEAHWKCNKCHYQWRDE